MGKLGKIVLLAASALLLSGCLFRPPDELYTRPEKSAEYSQLVSAIQAVRSELETQYGVKTEDALIVSGDNTATIQLQDLDTEGGGVRESALAFIRVPGAEKSLRIYIFTQQGDDYRVSGIIQGDGSAIYSVDYTDLNGSGKQELVVNWQVSAGVYQLGAYTLDELDHPHGEEGQTADLLATELLLTGCSGASDSTGSYSSGYRLLDIDRDTRTEIAVVHMESAGAGSMVEVYGWKDGAFVSMSTVGLSAGVVTLNRVRSNYLDGEYYPPALYVTCTMPDSSRTVDVLTYRDGVLHNLSLGENGVSENRLTGYIDVSMTDVNSDYVLEIPELRPLPTLVENVISSAYLVDWNRYNEAGDRSRVMTTYHNTTDGGYLVIPDEWLGKISVARNDTLSGQRQVVFSYWKGPDENPEPFLSIYKLTGSNRTTRATDSGRFVLREEAEVIYAARLYDCSWNSGLDETALLDLFRTIQTNWSND